MSHPTLSRLLLQRPLKLLLIRIFYLNMKCACRSCIQATLVIRQPFDYRYQLLIHSPISSYIRCETTRTLVSRWLLLLTRTIFPDPRRFLNIRFERGVVSRTCYWRNWKGSDTQFSVFSFRCRPPGKRIEINSACDSFSSIYLYVSSFFLLSLSFFFSLFLSLANPYADHHTAPQGNWNIHCLEATMI